MAAEAAEKAKKMQEEYIRRLQEKRQRELTMSHGLKTSKEQEEEDRKRKAMALMMGGRKGNVKKCFKAWVVGVGNIKQEREKANRENAWRRSCNEYGHDHHVPGACCAFKALEDPTFELPFDAWRAAAELDPSLLGVPHSPHWHPGGHSGEGSVGALALGSFYGNFSRPGRTSSSTPALMDTARPPGSTADSPRAMASKSQQRLPGRTSTTAGLRTSISSGMLPSLTASGGSAPGRPRQLPDFLDTENAEVVIHHATGRRCLLDRSQMRIGFADVGRNQHQSRFEGTLV